MIGRSGLAGLTTAVVAAAVAAAPAAAGPAGVVPPRLGAVDVVPTDAAPVLSPRLTSGDAIERALRSGARPKKLRAPRPAWFTKALQRKVERRGVVRAPADAPLPGEIGIRPGSWMISPYWCTMNFIFKKRSTVAIGTAGHCLTGSSEPVVLLTVAPTGGSPVLVQLGRVLVAQDAGIGNDYGLVEVPPSRYDWVFPTIGGVGGPCGVYTAMAPQPVNHYGHGLIIGTGGTPRAGQGIHVANDPFKLQLVWDADSFAWVGALAGGDSGSPVRVGTLGALGDLTHGIGLNVPGGDLPPSAIGWGTRVTQITAKGWTVMNSPLCA